MPAFRTRRVTAVTSSRPGLQRLELDDASAAYALTDQVGEVAPGDEVVVNTTAVDLGLGTGGAHVVHWNLARREWVRPGAGHIMKLRYTSAQVDTGAAEEHAAANASAPGERKGPPDGLSTDTGRPPAQPVLPRLDGTPVLIGGLHSQLGTAAAIVNGLDPSLRVAYVMTDGAALPIVISDLVDRLVRCGAVHTTITAGHAHGGDWEAVNTLSGIHIAVERGGADIVICTMGPGVVGTGSALGTTALEVADIASGVLRLGGCPVLMVRASDADPRPRHRGISHHTVSALHLCPAPLEVVVPPGLTGVEAIPAPHRVLELDPPDPAAALDRLGLTVTTMGRGPADDPAAFRTVAAAAAHAVGIARRRRDAHGAAGDGTVAPA